MTAKDLLLIREKLVETEEFHAGDDEDTFDYQRAYFAIDDDELAAMGVSL